MLKLFHVIIVSIVTVSAQDITSPGTWQPTTTGSPKNDVKLAQDYDYADTGVSINSKIPQLNTVTSLVNDRASWPIRARASLGSVYGAPTLGEKYEWLISRLRSFKRQGINAAGSMEELQRLFPNINVTQVFENLAPTAQGEEDEQDRLYRHRNGTHYIGEEDEMEGHYVNGTLQPGEGPEMDDAFYFNGTWYPGVREAEDGHYINGTWHPSTEEMEEGKMFNGTWQEENEEAEGQENENEAEEELMWWQLHHPKWRDRGTKEDAGVLGTEVQAHQSYEKETRFQQMTGTEEIPIQQPLVNQKIRHTPVHQYHKPPSSTLHIERPFAMPQHQVLQNGQDAEFQNSASALANQRTTYIENTPIQSPMFAGKQDTLPLPPITNVSPNSKSPPASGTFPESSIIKKTSDTKHGVSSALTWGIVIACVIAFTFILAPLACVLYKYRMEQRVKKRTFLKRPEHGSVDDGILDAMMMSELGEVTDSRIRKIGTKPSPWLPKGGRSPHTSTRSSYSSVSRHTSEQRQLTTMELGDGPEILIV